MQPVSPLKVTFALKHHCKLADWEQTMLEFAQTAIIIMVTSEVTQRYSGYDVTFQLFSQVASYSYKTWRNTFGTCGEKLPSEAVSFRPLPKQSNSTVDVVSVPIDWVSDQTLTGFYPHIRKSNTLFRISLEPKRRRG